MFQLLSIYVYLREAFFIYNMLCVKNRTQNYIIKKKKEKNERKKMCFWDIKRPQQIIYLQRIWMHRKKRYRYIHNIKNGHIFIYKENNMTL